MINVSMVRREFNPARATERASIYLAMEARFQKVVFSGKIHIDDMAEAIAAPKPSDYFLDSGVRDIAGRFWMLRGSLWDDVDEEAIRDTLRDVLAFLDPEVIEEAKTRWLCNHPANRALAARVMAGLSAGL